MDNKGKTKYQQQLKAGNKPSSGRLPSNGARPNTAEASEKARSRELADEIDGRFGFHRMVEGAARLGWLLNYLPITMPDSSGMEKAGIELYFIDRDGSNFKSCLFYQPYFFLDVSDQQRLLEVCNFLMRKFEGCFASVIAKEDLDLPNHLSGLQHRFVKIAFNTVSELVECKSQLRTKIEQNQNNLRNESNLESLFEQQDGKRPAAATGDPLDCLLDMREYDVPYAMRVAIDLDVRVGAWYTVTPDHNALTCSIEWQKDLLELCEPRVLAFDIECEKSPLKFPNPEHDRVFMISYMIANQGFLIINREIVSEDIEDFEYTPKPTFPGPFKVINVANERETLQYFLKHLQELRPHVITTYNGDKFDWPYLEIRLSKFPGMMSLYRALGISSGQPGAKNLLQSDMQYTGRCIVHLDSFCWVQRDSYLPQGNQGLKAVTKYKLGYDPVEVDPEDMLRFAKERPHHMASYSVSDAVATFYLYSLYVHNFIFSLSTIIPMVSEDVLRKGSGTLCEALLMVEAYKGNIVCPNKQVDPPEAFYDGHLLESETYIGGHVECLEAGVFRADIPVRFQLVPSAFQQLIDKVDRDLNFALEVEHGIQRSDVANYDEVKQQVVEKLELLRDCPDRMENPLIYHLDVGAMYPNIILTNRLQPSSMVDLHDCASCKYNSSANECKRPMTWTWRGEFSPATANEYGHIRNQLSYEKPTAAGPDGVARAFPELSPKDQAALVRARLKSYSQRVYRKTKVTKIEERVSTVCMRENSFYVDTVKAFRDRRYDYKLLTKVWKNKKSDADKRGDLLAKKQAEDREILMDSLQLAHKCILNSFYGYVMRKGARWRSMEMAGIVTHTGAQLIRQARELVEQVGRPLELDTDGIWCILPAIFPQNFTFLTKEKQAKVTVSYPCAMLNADVHDRYTNHQYQVLEKAQAPGQPPKYAMHSECSIFFELDGPYKAMVLPASPEEGRLLKKKYVVFNFNGSVAELKGFELKRRGELELVKIFQSQVFEQFLAGKTLQECYAAVADVANQWLDVLDSQGEDMDDEELLELISEKKTISKTVDDYEGRKSTSLTTAGRLADFLGAEMTKDKGLNCKLVISRYPEGAPVTDRAIPVAIFSCEPAMRRYFLRKWLKDNSLDGADFRPLIDWDYYKDRLGKTIQKIVTIPAGMQHQENPVPRVAHPPWLVKRLESRLSGKRQVNIRDAFRQLSLLKTPASVTESGRMGRKLLGPATATAAAVADEGDVDVVVDSDGDAAPGQKRVHFDADDADAAEAGAAEAADEAKAASDAEAARAKDAAAATPTAPSLLTEPPTTRAELQSWLTARKAVWRSRRQYDRQQARSAAGGDGFVAKRGTGRVLDFVQQATANALHNTWQILEVQRVEQQPGDFHVWALTSPTQLQRLSLSVARTIYVNIDPRHREAMATAARLGGRLVKKDLPHGKECLALFELQLSEAKFQRHEKTLDLFFTSPEVEGVYESQVPLELAVVMHTGCVARVASAASSSSAAGRKGSKRNAQPQTLLPFQLTGRYQLQDLEMVSTRAAPYLDARVAQFKKIFVYYAGARTTRSATSSGQLGMLGVFFVKENNVEEAALRAYWDAQVQRQTAAAGGAGGAAVVAEAVAPPVSCRAYVWVIHGRLGAAAAAYESKPPLQRLYRKYQPAHAHGEVKFTTALVADNDAAWRQANDRLAQYQRERPGPCVVIAQGGNVASSVDAASATGGGGGAAAGGFYGMDAAAWRGVLPALHDFPVTVMPAHSTDEAFPAVGWSMFAAERMVQRFLQFPRWFDDRLQAARFAQLPIGNFQADALTSMTDVLFARQLRAQRHVLWASETQRGVPDIGQGVHSHHDLWYVWSDPLPEPVINRPGVYRQYAVELDVYGLAVCAIMHSLELDDAASSAASSAAGGAAYTGGRQQAFTSAAAATSSTTDAADDGASGAATTLNATASTFSDQGCYRAFSVLKAIVAHCVEEVRHRNDAVADGLLTAIYRYLCGYGHGLLHDPQLHRLVYQYMVKLFARLMQTFQALGATVVHADFNRILIATRHAYSLPQALEYVDFLLSAVATKKLFAFVQLSVKQSWRALLWLEAENWAALNLPPHETDAGDDDDGAKADGDANGDAAEAATGDEAGAATAAEASDVDGADEAKAPAGDSDADADDDDDGDVEFGGRSVGAAKRSGGGRSDAAFFASLHDGDDVDRGDLRSIKRSVRNKQRAAAFGGAKKTRRLVAFADDADDADDGDADDDDDSDGGEDRDEDVGDYDEFAAPDERFVDASLVRRPSQSGGQFESVEALFDAMEEEDRRRQAQLEDELALARGDDADVLDGGADGDGRLAQHWNLLVDLPEAAAVYFQFLVAEFLLQYADTFDRLRHPHDPNDDTDGTADGAAAADGDEPQPAALLDDATGAAPSDPTATTTTALTVTAAAAAAAAVEPLSDEDAAAAAATHVGKWIERDFTSKMLQILDDLQLSYVAAKHSGRATTAADKTVALDFVKLVTHVLVLDDAHRDTVSTARRLLLAQLQLPEFSEASRFTMQQASYVLRDVLCGYCSLGRDLDLLRDPELLQAAHDARVTGQEAVWRCGHCGNALAREEIENRLLEDVERQLAVYLMQDFRCAKTHAVTARLATALSVLCEPLQMDVTPAAMTQRLTLLARVAELHRFGFLSEAVAQVLQPSG